MKYYILKKKEKSGPFEMSELKNQGVTKDTLVLSEALLEWTKANEVMELIDLFVEAPVPMEKSISYLMKEMGVRI